MILSLLLSLGITLGAEMGGAALLKLRDRRSLLVIFLANVITNPVVVYLANLQHLYGWFPNDVLLMTLLEAAAVGAEALIYSFALRPRIPAWLLSVVLNAASFLCGLLVNIILKQVFL